MRPPAEREPPQDRELRVSQWYQFDWQRPDREEARPAARSQRPFDREEIVPAAEAESVRRQCRRPRATGPIDPGLRAHRPTPGQRTARRGTAPEQRSIRRGPCETSPSVYRVLFHAIAKYGTSGEAYARGPIAVSSVVLATFPALSTSNPKVTIPHNVV